MKLKNIAYSFLRNSEEIPKEILKITGWKKVKKTQVACRGGYGPIAWFVPGQTILKDPQENVINEDELEVFIEPHERLHCLTEAAEAFRGYFTIDFINNEGNEDKFLVNYVHGNYYCIDNGRVISGQAFTEFMQDKLIKNFQRSKLSIPDRNPKIENLTIIAKGHKLLFFISKENRTISGHKATKKKQTTILTVLVL